MGKTLRWWWLGMCWVSASAGAEAPTGRTSTPVLHAASPVINEASQHTSSLPIPEAPATPPPPTRFQAPSSDPAGAAARSIARRVQHFRRYRAEVPGAVWSVDPGAVWSVRGQAACLRELKRLRVQHTVVERELDTPVPAAVQIEGSIEGVSFVSAHDDRTIEVSCELATRLPALARILRAHDVRLVLVNSSYRDQPKTSFHTFGLALDVAALKVGDETLSVAKHFEMDLEQLTCSATPTTPQGKALLAIACAVADSHLFSSVLTPNYNAGHRDHFHFDMRPDDPRFYVR